MSLCLNDIWTDRFPSWKDAWEKPIAFEMFNDLKQFISQKDNDLLQKAFDMPADQDVDVFIKEE